MTSWVFVLRTGELLHEVTAMGATQGEALREARAFLGQNTQEVGSFGASPALPVRPYAYRGDYYPLEEEEP